MRNGSSPLQIGEMDTGDITRNDLKNISSLALQIAKADDEHLA